MQKPAPIAPEVNRLWPLMSQVPSPFRRGGLQRVRIGAGARMRFGHAEAGAHVPGSQRRQVLLLLLRGADEFKHVHVALVRCHAVQGGGADRGVTGFLEDGRPVLQRQPLAAVLHRHVRREDPGVLGGLLQAVPL